MNDLNPHEIMHKHHADEHGMCVVCRFGDGSYVCAPCETYRLAEALVKATERERATKEALAETLTNAIKREQRARALVGDLSRALAESLHGPWDKAQERYADGTRSRDALPDWWSVMLGREGVDG